MSEAWLEGSQSPALLSKVFEVEGEDDEHVVAPLSRAGMGERADKGVARRLCPKPHSHYASRTLDLADSFQR